MSQRAASVLFTSAADLQAAGRLEDAVVAYRRGLTMVPNLAAAHLGLGLALASLHRLDEAAISLRQAVKLDPGLTPAHLALGNVLGAQQDYAAAANEFRKVLTRDSENAEAIDGLWRAAEHENDFSARRRSSRPSRMVRSSAAARQNTPAVRAFTFGFASVRVVKYPAARSPDSIRISPTPSSCAAFGSRGRSPFQ